MWVGGGLVGGVHHDENFRDIADLLEGQRADLDFIRGVDGITWDDFSVPLTLEKQGANTKPDYDEDEHGLLFPANDVTEIVRVVQQMLHDKLLGSDIYPHVHYIQEAAGQPTFLMDYRWYNNGGDVPFVGAPGNWITISTADGDKGIFPWTTNPMLQIATFLPIAAPANENVSSNFDFRFYRLADATPNADVLAKYIDIHYQKDSLGSDAEFVKQS